MKGTPRTHPHFTCTSQHTVVKQERVSKGLVTILGCVVNSSCGPAHARQGYGPYKEWVHMLALALVKLPTPLIQQVSVPVCLLKLHIQFPVPPGQVIRFPAEEPHIQVRFHFQFGAELPEI